MSFPTIKQNPTTFSVVPSTQRAPYGTIHNLSSLTDITQYAGSTLPVNLLSAGTLFVEPNSPITITLPSDTTFYKYLEGDKYLSNGDVLDISVINRGSSNVTFTHATGSQTVTNGGCDCLVLQWDLSRPKRPKYNILENCQPVIAQPITIDGYFSVDPPYLGTYNFNYIVSFAPFTNATSYTYDTNCPDPYLWANTSQTGATLYINWQTYAEFSITITGYNVCSSGSSTGTTFLPCFLAGSKVRMANGQDKNIEDVQIGELVVGAFGEINTVWALHRPLLGSSKMLCINEEHHTSSHHPHIGPEKQFYSHDPEAVSKRTYDLSHEVITDKGKEMWKLHGLKPERLSQLIPGVMLQTVDGPKQVTDLRKYHLPPTTQLYNLVIGGSHTYCVDGYAVTGWPREDDFDYDTWSSL